MLDPMIEKSELDKKIIDLVAEWSRRDATKISSSTFINFTKRGGLGVDGADADDLIGFVARRLGWELKDFDYDTYFGPEVGWNPVSALISVVKRERSTLTPLTVGKLSEYFFNSRPASQPSPETLEK